MESRAIKFFNANVAKFRVNLTGFVFGMGVTTILFSMPFCALANPSMGTIRGRITSSEGTPLPGSTVLLVNENRGVATDRHGQFQVDVTPGEHSLRFSFLGHESLQKNVMVNEGAEVNVDGQLQVLSVVMGEVMVSAQKREQSSIEVPVAISALSGSSLDRLNIVNLEELSAFIPGLQVQLQSPNNPGFVIRGVTSDDGDSRVQPRVSVFKDGVSISRARGAAVELFDMERVEVLKGPQGTLFGRGAQIGAVHLIQNKPVNHFSGEISVGAGTYNTRLASGYINTPVAGNLLYNRLAFTYVDRDGFISNLSGGRLNGKNTIAIRNSTRLLTGENGVVDLIVNFQRDDYPGTSFKSRAYAPAGGDIEPWTAADLEQGENLFIHRDVWGQTLLVNQKLNDRWDISSISAFRYFYSDESFDADGTAAPALWVSELAESKQASQELRFNFSSDNNLSGFFGGSFFWEDGSQRVPLRTNPQSLYTLFTPIIVGQVMANPGLPDATKQHLASLIHRPLLVNGVPVLVPSIPNIPAVFGAMAGAPLTSSHVEERANFGTTRAAEVFADGSYDLTQDLTLTLGLRGTYERITGSYLAESTGDASVLGFLMNNHPNILFPISDGKISESRSYFSYVGRVALNYMFGRNNLYATISRGRRSGVIDISPIRTNLLDPEIVWSYEVGVKGVVAEGRIDYDFTAFYFDWSNFQTSVFSIETGGLAESRDAGKAHSFGIETGLRYNLVNGVNVFASYGFIQARFNDEDSDGNPQEYSGNTFRLTPKHSFAAGLDFYKHLSNRLSFYLRPTYTYKSKVYFEDTNQAELSQEGFGLVNLTSGFRHNSVAGLTYQLGFFAKNLLDKKHIIDAGNTGNAFGIPTFIAGSRRVAGIELKVMF